MHNVSKVPTWISLFFPISKTGTPRTSEYGQLLQLSTNGGGIDLHFADAVFIENHSTKINFWQNITAQALTPAHFNKSCTFFFTLNVYFVTLTKKIKRRKRFNRKIELLKKSLKKIPKNNYVKKGQLLKLLT